MNCLLLSKISQSNCKWLFFAVKYGVPYGGTRHSEQLRRDTIWGYPEYGASNWLRHMVSPGLDGLRAKKRQIFSLWTTRGGYVSLKKLPISQLDFEILIFQFSLSMLICVR